jgi:hypothetical protein
MTVISSEMFLMKRSQGVLTFQTKKNNSFLAYRPGRGDAWT